MKNKLQGLIAGILIGSTLTGGMALARAGSENVEIFYKNIKIYKDNVLQELKGAGGDVIEPFIYNGTTYVPVRGAANLTGMNVGWDAETNSVYLWDKVSSGDTFLQEVCPPYETGIYNSGSFMMAGKEYANGFTSSFYEQTAYFNLNGKYSELSCIVGHVDGWGDRDKSIAFYVDGKKVQETAIFAGEMPKQITVPLNNGAQLKIQTNVNGEEYIIGVGNIVVK